MIALAIVIAILLIIALLPVGARFIYSAEGIKLDAVAGLITVKILPQDPKPKVEKKKEKKPKKEKKKSKKDEKDKDGSSGEKKKKNPGTVKLLLKLLPEVGKFLNRFRKKLRINHLTAYYTSASDDPFKAAMTYGAINAGAGTVLAALSRVFRIKKHDIRTNVSFTETEPTVYIDAKLTIRVWQIIHIALCFAVGFIKVYLKLRKGGKNNGKASDRRSDGHDHAEDQGNGGRKHDNRNPD